MDQTRFPYSTTRVHVDTSNKKNGGFGTTAGGDYGGRKGGDGCGDSTESFLETLRRNKNSRADESRSGTASGDEGDIFDEPDDGDEEISASVDCFRDAARPKKRKRAKADRGGQAQDKKFFRRGRPKEVREFLYEGLRELSGQQNNNGGGDDEGEASESDESSCELLLRVIAKARRDMKRVGREELRKVACVASDSGTDSASLRAAGICDVSSTEFSGDFVAGDSPVIAAIKSASETHSYVACFWCGYGKSELARVNNEHYQIVEQMMYGDLDMPIYTRARRIHGFYKKYIFVNALLRGQLLPIWRTKDIIDCMKNHQMESRCMLAEHACMLRDNIRLLELNKTIKLDDGTIAPNLKVMSVMASQIKEFDALSKRNPAESFFYRQNANIAGARAGPLTITADARLSRHTNRALMEE